MRVSQGHHREGLEGGIAILIALREGVVEMIASRLVLCEGVVGMIVIHDRHHEEGASTVALSPLHPKDEEIIAIRDPPRQKEGEDTVRGLHNV